MEWLAVGDSARTRLLAARSQAQQNNCRNAQASEIVARLVFGPSSPYVLPTTWMTLCVLVQCLILAARFGKSHLLSPSLSSSCSCVKTSRNQPMCSLAKLSPVASLTPASRNCFANSRSRITGSGCSGVAGER